MRSKKKRLSEGARPVAREGRGTRIWRTCLLKIEKNSCAKAWFQRHVYVRWLPHGPGNKGGACRPQIVDTVGQGKQAAQAPPPLLCFMCAAETLQNSAKALSFFLQKSPVRDSVVTVHILAAITPGGPGRIGRIYGAPSYCPCYGGYRWPSRRTARH